MAENELSGSLYFHQNLHYNNYNVNIAAIFHDYFGGKQGLLREPLTDLIPHCEKSLLNPTGLMAF